MMPPLSNRFDAGGGYFLRCETHKLDIFFLAILIGRIDLFLHSRDLRIALISLFFAWLILDPTVPIGMRRRSDMDL